MDIAASVVVVVVVVVPVRVLIIEKKISYLELVVREPDQQEPSRFLAQRGRELYR
jgi:hypothetical protein